MAPLASIPEVSHPNLNDRANQSRYSRIASFERARRRSRVLIISRHSPRLRRRTISPEPAAPQPDQNPSASGGKSEAFATNRQRKGKDVHSVSKHADARDASELKSPRCPTPAGSDVSIDIDSFPLPPSHRKAVLYSQSPAPDSTIKHTKAFETGNAAPPEKNYSRQELYRLKVQSKALSSSADSHHRHPGSFASRGPVSQTTRKQTPVDADLVDTITKSVADNTGAAGHVNIPGSRNRSGGASRSQLANSSRSPSQVRALDTFTKELHRYAETVGARGKAPYFTSTPSKSSATLRTVSALLPFRSEFQAAGLAVTSQDQRQPPTRASVKVTAINSLARTRRQKTVNVKRFGVLQVDGKVDSVSEPTTAVEFTTPNNADEWRRSLVDDLPPKKNVLFPYRPRSRRSCFPCLSKRRIRIPVGTLLRKKAVETPLEHFARPPTTPSLMHSSRSSSVIPSRPVWSAYHKVTHRNAGTVKNPTSRPVARSSPKDSLYAELGLRRKRKAVAGSHPGGNGVNESQKEIQLFPPVYETDRPSTTDDNNDGASHQPGNVSSNESRGNKDQPHHPLMDHGNLSFPELPPVHRRQAGRTPPLHALRDFLTDRLTAKAMQDISLHDYGRYPAAQFPSRLRPAFSLSKPPDIPSRVSSRRCQAGAGKGSSDSAGVEDRDVLKGLHIAAAAACDKSVHTIVHESTGVNVRRFLAELIAFDILGQSQQSDDGEKPPKRRQAHIRKLKQQVRASRKRMQKGLDAI